MAMTNAEKQRNYRERLKRKQQATQRRLAHLEKLAKAAKKQRQK